MANATTQNAQHNTQAQAPVQNTLALVKKDTVDVVAARIREYQERGELHFPANYSPENAMKSAWLTLQSTVTKDNKPVLEACTRDSIANSLLDMVILGLNPSKKQCYFIAYGNKLACQRSYFGSEVAAKSVAGVTDVLAEVVYKGDEFAYRIEKGRKYLDKHIQKLENIDGKNVVAAYALLIFDDGRPDYMDVMTFDEIKQAWKQGPNYKEDGYGTHQKFPTEMVKKTVINRACKAYINSSDDSNLLIRQAFNRADEIRAESNSETEIAEHANGQIIDVQATVIDDAPAGEGQTEQNGGPGF